MFIFQSRSRLRPINRKTGAWKTPFSDVKPPGFYRQILVENVHQINQTSNENFHPDVDLFSAIPCLKKNDPIGKLLKKPVQQDKGGAPDHQATWCDPDPRKPVP
jgi:hypothetical protein